MMRAVDNKLTCSCSSRSGQVFQMCACLFRTRQVHTFAEISYFGTITTEFDRLDDSLPFIPIDLLSIIIDFALPQTKPFHLAVQVLSSTENVLGE